MKKILRKMNLDFAWETADPFLACLHHEDFYPEGNKQMAPAPELLIGRNIGQDFETKDGWRMYHGQKIPGFPAHPHRGFETVTIVCDGYVDHADSIGASGRYGMGDTQWMTAGKGIQHSEMFPLIHKDKPNRLELFQIWLNLPAKNKMVEPHYEMLWRGETPVLSLNNDSVKLTLVAGKFEGKRAASPPPDSWALDPENHVAIWLIELSKGATWDVPLSVEGVNRYLYCYQGDHFKVENEAVKNGQGVQLNPTQNVHLGSGTEPTKLLLLQGMPINEPIVQSGPFVMNSNEEVQQAYRDYQQTQFGGWPWKSPAWVHERDLGRFAVYADGKKEKPHRE